MVKEKRGRERISDVSREREQTKSGEDMYTRTYHYHTHVKTSCIILMRTYIPVYTYTHIYINMYVYFDVPFADSRAL